MTEPDKKDTHTAIQWLLPMLTIFTNRSTVGPHMPSTYTMDRRARGMPTSAPAMDANEADCVQ